MNWTILFGFLSLVSGMICAGIAIYLAHYRDKIGARQLMLMMASVFIWSLGYGMEFLSPDLSLKLWWVRFEYAGCSWLGVMFFRFVCTISEKNYCQNRCINFFLLMIPVVIFFLALTNGFHHLMWEQASLESNFIIQGIIFKRALGFWVYVVFSYGLILWATLILIKKFVFSKGIYRKQLTLILYGIMVPWLCNMLYLFGFQVLRNIDLTPFSFMITGMLFAWGLFRYQLLNLIPMAHEAVIDGMGDPVIVMDMNDRVMKINKACSKTFGIKIFASGQETAKEMFPGLYNIVSAHRKNKAIEIEVALEIKGISRQWYLRISPLLTPKEKQSGWVIFLRDITEQQLAETAIRESEKRHRTMLEASPTPIVYYSEKGEVTYVNLAFTRVFGWEREELIGKPLDFIPEKDKQSTRDAISRTYAHPHGKFDFISQRYTKTKELLDVSINSALYRDKEGKQTCLVVNYTDISERIKIEEVMVQSEKMISVGGLAAGMAHEINNPLAGILQTAQVIKNRLSKPLPANIEAAEKHGVDLDLLKGYLEERGIFYMMDQIASVGRRAAKIVENMLSFSRKSDSRRSSHYLHEMVESTLDLVQNDFTLKNQYDIRSVEIIRKIENDLPPVPCEKTKIQQVFFNILKNGAEAMSDAKVSSPRFVIRYFLEQNMAAVEISNNGPCIPENIRKRIFEPFFTTKEVGVGTGLGLSVSYFIIKENHNGELVVESTPGKETAFIIKLPI